VKLIDLTSEELTAEHMGGRSHVAITATDLAVRAKAALIKSELDANEFIGSNVSVVPADGAKTSAEPEAIKEASRDEISKGLGALYTHQATTFRLFAPTAKFVSVVLYDAASGNEGR